MVFRKEPFKWGYRSVKKRTSRWLQHVNELPKTENDQIYPQLPFLIRAKKYKMKYGLENTPGGQLKNLTFAVSELFRDERVLLGYNKATEIRPYAERLIVEAMRHGDCHRPTMAMANFWLREKNLIHKLFKVLVPRYMEFNSSFTALHVLGKDYAALYYNPGDENARPYHREGQAVLELRGNSLPPIIRPQLNKSGLITNLLVGASRARYEAVNKISETR